MDHRTALLSALILAAPAPAFAADATSAPRDSQGNVVRSSTGACVSSGTATAPEPGCLPPKKPQTFRLLQGMIPQPTVTTAAPDANPMPSAETVQIALAQPWERGSSMLSPTQREELYSVLSQLESYWRVERFEVVTYPGAAQDAGYNRWLAERRSSTLTGFLASAGVMPMQISARVGDPAAAPRSELTVTVRGRR
jgi:outer membrane protein OmpA-like peptidoglycan-associated protein